MSEMINAPRYGAYQAQMELERAEAIVDAFCQMYDRLALPFTRGIAAVKDGDALSIRRAWLRASA